jgi:hypothetical protein
VYTGPSEHERKMCLSKGRFVLEVARARSRETGLRLYACMYCEFFHLTKVGVERESLDKAKRMERKARARRRKRKESR